MEVFQYKCEQVFKFLEEEEFMEEEFDNKIVHSSDDEEVLEDDEYEADNKTKKAKQIKLIRDSI